MKKLQFKKLSIANNNQNSESLSIPYLQKGTYILILYLSRVRKIQIGKLGNFNFKKGYYGYVGSAFGPGGLTARLKHHLKITDNPHWHIDYLRKEVVLRAIWISEYENRLEHLWAGMLLGMEGAFILVPGFGSSDCKCEAHVVYFRNRPRFQKFQNLFNIDSL